VYALRAGYANGVQSMREAQATPTVFSLDFFRDTYQNSDHNIDFLPKKFDLFWVNGF
jgi:hypothetical protein